MTNNNSITELDKTIIDLELPRIKILDYLNVIGFYKLPLNYLDEYNKKVESVTAAQIKDAFNRRLNTKNFVTVIVGDPKAQ